MTLAQRAIDARTSLFSKYDQLNLLFEAAEQELTRHHVPHAFSHEYIFRENEQGNGLVFALGIQKIKGKWRLCHTSYWYPHEYYDGDYIWTPIVECSGEHRIQAAGHIAGLREKLVESLEGAIPKADEAIRNLRSTVAELKSDDLVKLLAERAKLNGKAK